MKTKEMEKKLITYNQIKKVLGLDFYIQSFEIYQTYNLSHILQDKIGLVSTGDWIEKNYTENFMIISFENYILISFKSENSWDEQIIVDVNSVENYRFLYEIFKKELNTFKSIKTLIIEYNKSKNFSGSSYSYHFKNTLI